MERLDLGASSSWIRWRVGQSLCYSVQHFLVNNNDFFDEFSVHFNFRQDFTLLQTLTFFASAHVDFPSILSLSNVPNAFQVTSAQ